jgi:uncharacterized protein YwqG
MDRDELLKAARLAGLERVISDVGSLIADSVWIKSQPADEAVLELGASRLGGLPDLPPTLAWPRWKNTPQSFVAQLRLSDVHQYEAAPLLPASGWLYFFYDAAQEVYGGNPADRGGWAVLYYPGDGSSLVRHPAPPDLPAQAQFRSLVLAFSVESTLPQRPEVFLPKLDWTPQEQDLYSDFAVSYRPPEDRALPHHQLLGHAHDLQDDMHIEVQLASHGLNVEKGETSAELEGGALDWLLLLQIDSDPNAGMRWGSSGMLYYWIERRALEARHFEDVWCVLQST